MADYSVRFGDEASDDGLIGPDAPADGPAQPVGPQLSPFGPVNLSPFVQGLDDPGASPFAPTSAVDGAKEWFTGRNLNGMQNGWDTEFQRTMLAQANAAMEEGARQGNASVYYERFSKPDATGVVTWTNEAQGLRAGDVFLNGQKQENIYDVYGRDTANLLMTKLFDIEGYTQVRDNKTDEPAEARAARVEGLIEAESRNVVGARQQGDFVEDVNREQEVNDEAKGALGSLLAGAGAGSASGALGFAAGPVVGAFTTIGGGIVGGITGFLNRDRLNEVASTAIVKTQRAADESQGGNNVAGLFAAVEGFGAVGMQSANIFTNTVEGVRDITAEGAAAGDNIVEWDQLDLEKMQPKVNGAWQTAHLAAAFGDSALSFLSGPASIMYFANMGAYSIGKSGNVFLQDQTFNNYTGTWDELEGPKEELAAGASSAIDFVQMGMAGGLLSRTKSLQQAAGLRPADDAMDAATRAVWRRLPGGKAQTNDAGDVVSGLTKKGSSEVVNGKRVFKDEMGAVTDARFSVQILAPSEFTKYVTTQWFARRRAVADGGRGVTADDFYQASQSMQDTAGRFGNAMLAAFAEGNEEAAQAVLDPISVDESIDGRAVYKSYLYGMASGAGMGLAAQAHRGKNPGGYSNRDLQALGRAKRNMEARFGEEYTTEEFKMLAQFMNPDDLKRWAAPQDAKEVQEQAAAIEAMKARMEMEDSMNNGLGFTVVGAAVQQLQDANLPKINNSTGFLTAVARTPQAAYDPNGLFDHYAADPSEVDVSLYRLMQILEAKVVAVGEHAAGREVRLADLQAKLEQARAAGDTTRESHFTRLIQETQDDASNDAEMQAAVAAIRDDVLSFYEQIKDPSLNDAGRRALVQMLNDNLRSGARTGKWYDAQGQLLNFKSESVRRVTEFFTSRMPWMDQGFMINVGLQVDWDMDLKNDHGTMHVSPPMYAALNLDLDGDQLQQQIPLVFNTDYLSPNQRKFYREGRQFLGQASVDEKKKIASEKTETDWLPADSTYKVLMDPMTSEVSVIQGLAASLVGKKMIRESEGALVVQEIERFTDWVRTRYSGPLDPAKVDAAIEALEIDLRKGSKKARTNFMETLANIDPVAFLAIEEGRQEAVWLSWKFTEMLQRAQSQVARLRGAQLIDPDPDTPGPILEANAHIKSSATVEAATVGGLISLVLSPDYVRADQQLNFLEIIKAGFEALPIPDGDGNRAGIVDPRIETFARMYMLFNSSTSETKNDELDALDRIPARVFDGLQEMVNNIMQETGAQWTRIQQQNAMLVLSNIAMPDFDIDFDGAPGEGGRNGTITLLQLLLRRSIQAEKQVVNVESWDSDRKQRLDQMERATRNGKDHSYAWAQALEAVFGPSTFQDMLGTMASTLGPNTTFAQRRAILDSLDPEARKQWIHVAKKGDGGYQDHRGLGDPPYFFGTGSTVDYLNFLESGQINGYTVLIDALAAVGNNDIEAKKQRNETYEEKIQGVFVQLRGLLQEYLRVNGPRLVDLYGAATEATAFKDLVSYNSEFISAAAELFSPESRLSTFGLSSDTATRSVLSRSWASEIFTIENPAEAVHMLHVYTEMDRFIQLGKMQSARTQKVFDDEKDYFEAIYAQVPDTMREVAYVLEGLRYDQIESRLGQRIYIAMQKMRGLNGDGGFAFLELSRALFQTDTNEQMYAAINASPVLRNGDAELMAWYNDVADFQVDPSQLFNASRAGATQREVLVKLASKFSLMRQQLAERDVDHQAREQTVALIRDALETPDKATTLQQELLTRFRRLILNARSIPSISGPNTYDQMLEGVIEAFYPAHEKSKTAEFFQGLGASIFDAMIGTRTNDVAAEVANVNARSMEDVLANPRILLTGPMTIQVEGGATVRVNWADERELLDALENRTLHPLALAALGLTARDVTTTGSVMPFSVVLGDSRSPYAFDKMLAEANFSDLHPAGGRLSYEDALLYLGTLEGVLVQGAQEGTEDEKREATLQVSNLLNDVLIRYINSPAAEGKSRQKIKEEVVRSLVAQIQEIARYAGSNTSLREQLHSLAKMDMQDRVGAPVDPIELMRLVGASPADIADEQTARVALANMLYDKFAKETTAFIADPRTSQKERDMATAHLKRITDMYTAGDYASLLGFLQAGAEYIPFETIVKFYTPDTSGSKKAFKDSVERILDYLDTGDKMSLLHRLKLGDEARAVWSLLEKRNFGIGYTIDEALISDWKQLSHFIAQIVYRETYSPTSTNAGILAVDPDDKHDVAYIDASSSYLLDGIFDNNLLNAAVFLGGQSGWDTNTGTQTEDVLDHIVNGLFSQQLIGDWQEVAINQSRQIRRTLGGVPVNDSLTTAGGIPEDEKADLIASLGGYDQAIDMNPNSDVHMSTYVMPIKRGENTDQALSDNPLMLLSLEHHYVQSVVLVDSNGVEVKNITLPATVVGSLEQRVKASGLRVLTTATLRDAVDEFFADPQNASVGNVTVSIRYVDVLKKPATDAYANSAWFDGVGRNNETGTSLGPVASMFFATLGVNKLMQQFPLDFATNSAESFFAYVPAGPAVVGASLARANSTITEQIGYKTLHVWNPGQAYSFGSLQRGDINGIYRIIKFRNLARAQDGTLLWAEQAMAIEQAAIAQGVMPGDPNFPTFDLIELSAPVAQRLLQNPTLPFVQGQIDAPLLIASDGQTRYPPLDADTLTRLGLYDLGKEGSLLNSAAATYSLGPQARLSQTIQDAVQRPHQMQLHKVNAPRVAEAHAQRATIQPKGERVERRNTPMRKKLEDNRRIESMLPLLANTPRVVGRITDLVQTIRNQLAGNVELDNFVEDRSLMWYYDGDARGVTGMNQGVITNYDVAQGLNSDGIYGNAVDGDVLVINIGEVLKNNALRRGSQVPDKAEVVNELQQLVTAAVKQGLTIELFTTGGPAVELQHELKYWMVSNHPYRAVAGSTTTFVPVTQLSNEGANMRFTQDSLTRVDVYDNQNVDYVFYSVDDLGLSEGGAYVVQDQWTPRERHYTSLGHLSLTYSHTGQHTRGGATSYTFGLPFADGSSTSSWAETSSIFLDLLDTEEGAQLILDGLRQGRETANPDNTPLMRVDGDLVEPGVVPDNGSAINNPLIERFRANLRRPEPLVGTQMAYGDLYLQTDNYGHTVVMRWKFKPPTGVELNEQFNDGDFQDRVDALLNTQGGVRIAFASAKDEKQQTIPPPFTVTEVLRNNRVAGHEALNLNGKIIFQGFGFKTGVVERPATMTPVGSSISRTQDQDVVLYTPAKEAEKKGVVMPTNFRDGIAMYGLNLREVLTDYFTRNTDFGTKDREEQWKKIQTLLHAWQSQDNQMTPEELRALWDTGRYFDAIGLSASVQLGEMAPQAQLDRVFQSTIATKKNRKNEDPVERISLLILSVLQLPGVRLEHVLGAPGFINLPPRSENKTIKMPFVLTSAFDDPFYPQTQALLFKLMNDSLSLTADGKVWQRLNGDWHYERLVYDATQTPTAKNPYPGMRWIRGYLAPQVLEQANENPDVAANQLVVKGETRITPYMSMQASMLAGGAYPYDPRRAKEDGVAPDPLQTFMAGIDPETQDDDLFSLLPKIRLVDNSFSASQSTTYAAQKEQERADKRGRQYSIPVPKDSEDNPDPLRAKEWGDKARFVMQAQRNVIKVLNMEDRDPTSATLGSANEKFLDLMVRLHMGRPGAASDQAEGSFADITADEYIGALEDIYTNLKKNMLPSINGELPLPHQQLIFRVIFDAQKGKLNPWAPRVNSNGKLARYSYDEWVLAAFGQVYSSKFNFQYMYTADFLAMWRTYKSSTVDTQDMALTPNQMVQAGLMSPNTEEAVAHYKKWAELQRKAEKQTGSKREATLEKMKDFELRQGQVTEVLSPDRGDNAMMQGTILREDELANLDALLGSYKLLEGSPYIENSWVAGNKRHQSRWRAKQGLQKQDQQPMTNYLSDGKKFVGEYTFVNGVGRFLNNAALINRMLNPAIWFSGFIELPIRLAMQSATDALTGTSIGRSGRWANNLADLAGRVGVDIHPMYSNDEIRLIHETAQFLGSHETWRDELVEQLNYQILVARGEGNVGWQKRLERLAGAVAKPMSDPRWGISGTYLAELYIGGVLEYLNMTSGNVINVEQFVTELRRDPMRYAKNTPSDFGPHIQGLHRLEQTRSMKPTMLSSAIMRPLAAGQRSERAIFSFPAAILHIPFQFTTFNVNALTTFTGMQGWDQTAAFMLDGRFKRLFGKNVNDRMDFTDVIETIDLQKTFIRDGITVTSIFTMAMLFGGMGLGGEDEEERRRQRMARYLHIEPLGDPLNPQNDFRWADAIYLDKIPVLNTFFRNQAGNSAVVPHWTLKQFTSPIMGVSRFMETGDFREVLLGFWDAFTAMPTSVGRLWDNASLMSTQLIQEAQREIDNDPNGSKGELTQETQNLLTNNLVIAVSILERALLENAMINGINTFRDEVDRNPYLLPRTDEQNGNQNLALTQGQQFPQQTDARVAISVGEGEDRQIISPYIKRSDASGDAHNYAKNNAVFGWFASLFTGQNPFDGSFQRQNMVPRAPVVEREDLSLDAASALVYAAYFGVGGKEQLRLSESDIYQLYKQQATASGVEWDQLELESKAALTYMANNGDTALATTLEDGTELTSKYGDLAIIRSLMKEGLKPGDPALAGWGITYEQRQELGIALQREIKQDAIDAGLSNESANYVLRRVWNGAQDSETPGLGEILWSDAIPWSRDIRYTQLNMSFQIGPDGRPWATPFERTQIFAAFGVPSAMRVPDAPAGFTLDSVGNTVDTVNGINTGLAGLAPTPIKPLEKPTEEVERTTMTPNKNPYYSRRRGSGFGGGGGGGYFKGLDRPPSATPTRVDGTPYINTSNPYVRRARVDRERVFSDRGRLNQWQ